MFLLSRLQTFLNLTLVQTLSVICLWIPGVAFSQVYVNGETRNLAVTLYDWPETSPDFGTSGGECGSGLRLGYVAKALDAEGKPSLGSASCKPKDLLQWFRTQEVLEGYSNAICYDLEITYNAQGLWVADYPSFFPMDDFTHLDEGKTIVNPWNKKTSDNRPHNYSFTMEIDAEFVYKKGQTFDFRGDDDVFVFINNELVVDIGGVHNPLTGNVNLDTLGLVEGSNYSFKIFFAERQESGSSFKMATSMDLRTRRELILQSVRNGKTTLYNVNERQTKSKQSCSLKETDADTVMAPSDFVLEGANISAKPLDIGLNLGGISIAENSASVTIDLEALAEAQQLEEGAYEVIIALKSDATQKDTIRFEIAKEIDPCEDGSCKTAKVVKASVFDLDADGTAETIRVEFDRSVQDLAGIYSIDWPTEGENNLSSDLSNTSYEKLEGGEVDSSILIVDMRSKFTAGTQADTAKPPYLNFREDSVLMEDKMGPILLEASKTYPKEIYYAVLQKDGSLAYFENPITLTIKSSEPLVLADSINSLFSYKPSYDATPENLTLSKAPEVLNNPNKNTLSLSNEMINKIEALQYLSFHSELKVKDVYDNNAVPAFVKVQESKLGQTQTMGHNFRDILVGDREESVVNLSWGSVRLYDTEGEYIKKIPGETEVNKQWVAPYNYKQGDFLAEALCVDQAVVENFPGDCRASLVIGSFKGAGPYTAKIYIYDQLGQFITKWSQSYGYCGEFENLSRSSLSDTKDYFIQDLVWDLKDYLGDPVGTGVYLWKVMVQFEEGKSYELLKRMGVLRNVNDCVEDD